MTTRADALGLKAIGKIAKSNVGTIEETAATGGGTFDKLVATTVLSPLGEQFDMPANNRLRYIGTPTKTFAVWAVCSYGPKTAAFDTRLQIRKYSAGDVLDATVSDRTSVARNHSNTDIGNVSTFGIITLATNEYVELWAAKVAAGAATINCEALHIMAVRT